MSIKELINYKRDKNELSKEEIFYFIEGVTNNTVTDEQIAAMAMAICINKLSATERSNLTLAMRDSGDNIVFDNLNNSPIVDKHSTGGVGDLVSIPLAPIVAACGAYVPMITGKGLGHTGGTTDKLNSIPGYNTTPTVEDFKRIVKDVGCAVIGQTTSLAPADKRIYAVRDTTGTVESLDLIASSILSKKLASGINSLVMDVKVGSGAFMTKLEDATNLAQAIVDIANSLNTKTISLITDMNECLADSIGNSLEIEESIEFLKGNFKSKKLKDITFALAERMLLVSGVADTLDSAKEKVENALSSGKAAEIFEKMVHALGGPSDMLTNYSKYLPKAPIVKPIYATNEGYVKSINARILGATLVTLGGGRKTINDELNLSVGLTNVVKLGDKVDKSTPIAFVYATSESMIQQVAKEFNSSLQFSNSPVETPPSIHKIIE